MLFQCYHETMMSFKNSFTRFSNKNWRTSPYHCEYYLSESTLKMIQQPVLNKINETHRKYRLTDGFIVIPLFFFILLVLLSIFGFFGHDRLNLFNVKNGALNSGNSQCSVKFQGFGVFLGKIQSFNRSGHSITEEVIDLLVNDLQLRHFRTEYLPKFSTKEDEININCRDLNTCTWNSVMNLMKQHRDNVTFFASIWSPPYYMVNHFLRRFNMKYQEKFYNFIKNVSRKISEKYNVTVSPISLNNEPEDVFASWDQCFMTPLELCGLVDSYNDPDISICTENSYYWITQLYMDTPLCQKACKTVITHGYKLNLNRLSLNYKQVYYDLTLYPKSLKPLWITEISSTYLFAEYNQNNEAIDMATNIAQFLGFTCAERYYYWLAYSDFASGESLIWNMHGRLYLPKKYFAFRHFTRAARRSEVISSEESSVGGKNWRGQSVLNCSNDDTLCVRFGLNATVYVNNKYEDVDIGETCNLCCTSSYHDWKCSIDHKLPPRSVCSC